MAEIFVDPTVSGVGTGTYSDPYKSWSSVTFNHNDIIRQRCGTVAQITGQLAINYKSRIRIESYGSGDRPVITSAVASLPSDWTEVSAANLTTPTAGTGVWRRNGFRWVRFGDLRTVGKQVDSANVVGAGVKAPSAPYEFGHVSGGVVVWAPTNPVTYYGQVFVSLADYAFYVLQPVNAFTLSEFQFVDLMGGAFVEMGGTPVIANNVSIQDCHAENVFWGFRFGGANGAGFNNLRVQRNTGSWINASFIAGGSQVYNSSSVRENTLSDACLTYSDGGIYFAGSYSNDGSRLYLENNDVRRVKRGNIWVYDGCGLYFDFSSNNGVIRNNRISECDVAIQLNTAKRDIQVVGNIGVSTNPDAIFAIFTDSMGNNDGDVKMHNNTAIGYSRGVSIGAIGSNSTYTLRNNLFARGSGSGNSFGIFNNNAADHSKIVESNNAISGFTKAWTDVTGTAYSLGAGTITSNPLLDHVTYRPLPGSPLIGAGVNVGPLLDKSGKRFARQPSIGAYEFVRSRLARF